MSRLEARREYIAFRRTRTKKTGYVASGTERDKQNGGVRIRGVAFISAPFTVTSHLCQRQLEVTKEGKGASLNVRERSTGLFLFILVLSVYPCSSRRRETTVY